MKAILPMNFRGVCVTVGGWSPSRVANGYHGDVIAKDIHVGTVL